MQPSDNLYAECLLRLMEPRVVHGMVRGGVAAAHVAVCEANAAVGVNPRKLRLLDGSGMCAKNWICPRACIQLLQGKARAGEEGKEFDAFLPVAADPGMSPHLFSSRFCHVLACEQKAVRSSPHV
jgi:D-alanyl-D-alanine carboxypeptidase